MKFTVVRRFSLKNKEFEIICNSKTFCTAKIRHSKEYKDRYNIKLSNPINKYIGEDISIVEPNPNQTGSYLIYLKNNTKKTLFGQICYQPWSYNDYLYQIIIGEKLYQARSSDLKDRRLTIIDTFQSINSSRIDSPEILLQVLDTFSKTNKKYRVTINDTKYQYGYLAIVVLLNLLECKRNGY